MAETPCICGATTVERREKGPHLGAYCMECGKWLRWEPKPITLESALVYPMPFGKHRGLAMGELPPGYVDWLADNCMDAKISRMARLIQEARDAENA